MKDVSQDVLAIYESMPKLNIETQGDGWVNLATLGAELQKNGVDYKSYGYEKLKLFIDSFSGLFVEYKDISKNIPVYFIKKCTGGNTVTISKKNNPKRTSPKSALTDWAFLGHYPTMIKSLASLALDGEKWYFENDKSGEENLPILSNYLHYTFFKLQQEDKITYSESKEYAAFNTGLVDKRYESIYALFRKNSIANRPQNWYLVDFCIDGEDRSGKTLVDQFRDFPKEALYFHDVSDMLYDTKSPKPSLDAEHIIIENIHRLPFEFIKDNAPKNFEVIRPENLNIEDREKYFDQLRVALKKDTKTYRSINNRLEDAVNLAIKRIQWNFKSAIPMYYPKRNKMCFLLPLCLIEDSQVDVALVISRGESGRYQGETIYPLNWAYQCARLVCRPDSDWLNVDRFSCDIIEEDEE